MRFASLGSGSEGNALIVEVAVAGGLPCRIMLDCGFGLKECESRLARLGIAPASLAAILVTHEHGDHIGGVLRLARRHSIPIRATYGTLQAVARSALEGLRIHACSGNRSFSIGALEVHPYSVPHDAREPVQFVFSDGVRRLGVLTDAGRSTSHIRDSLEGCDALVMECNHDRALLEASDYPYPLKRRIGGGFGHLSNDVAAEIVASLDRSRLRHVVAAHLSRKNNTPELARAALAAALAWRQEGIEVADQSSGLGWIDLASNSEACRES